MSVSMVSALLLVSLLHQLVSNARRTDAGERQLVAWNATPDILKASGGLLGGDVRGIAGSEAAVEYGVAVSWERSPLLGFRVEPFVGDVPSGARGGVPRDGFRREQAGRQSLYRARATFWR